MSRTIRKPRYYIEHNDVSYLNERRGYNARITHDIVKVRLSDDEYSRKVDKAEREYRAEIEKNGGEYRVDYNVFGRPVRYEKIRKPWVSRYRYERVPVTLDEIEAKDLDYRNKSTRDGKFSESGRKQAFKRMAKDEVRREWKKMKNKIVKGEDYDEYCPHDRLGKKHIWSVW